MKRLFYKTISVLLLSVISLHAGAYDFEYNGLAYTVLDVSQKTVQVSDKSGKGYNIDIAGIIEIPEKVKYNDVEFTVTTIGTEAFRYGNMEEVRLPQTITSIGKRAFSICRNLKKINLPEGLLSIEANGINSAVIDSLIIPSTVTNIGTYALSSRFNYLEFSEGIKSIPPSACHEVYIKKLVLPSTLKEIGAIAFGTVDIIISKAKISPSNFDSYSYASNGTYITYYNPFTSEINDSRPIHAILVPKGSKESYQLKMTQGKPAWPAVAFEEYDEITDFSQIGISFDSGDNTYMITNASDGNHNVELVKCKKDNCTELTIPKSIKMGSVDYSVKTINPQSFSKNTNLMTINVGIDNPISIYDNTFSAKTFLFANIFVPGNAVESYKDTEIWKNFSNIMPLNMDIPIQSPNVLSINDETPNIPSGYYYRGCIEYARNVSNEYGTFCFPFTINLNEFTGIDKVYIPMDEILYNTSTNWLMLLLKEQNMESTIPAGTPFLAKLNGADVNVKSYSSINFTNDVTSNPTPKKLTVFNFNGTNGILKENKEMDVYWGGTYVNTSATDGLNSFNSDGTFGQHTGNLNPFRAYIMQSSVNGAKVAGIMFNFDDAGATTGITNINKDNHNENVYNLQGQKVKTTHKGNIYIINGRKVLK